MVSILRFFGRISPARLGMALFLGIGLMVAQMMPTIAQAQDEQSREDQGFVTRFLEENLSGAGRRVTLTGFHGALSSRATFHTLTIADEDGIWITLRNGAIQWNRSALLRRRVDIAELFAEEIDLPRLPGGGQENGATPEAKPFNLPELPVAILIEKLEADRVSIGEAVIGEAAIVSVRGAMVLSGGEGEARLTIERQDEKRGRFRLDAGFANDTRVLRTDLDLDEAEDGLLANLIGLHGRPSLAAKIHGEGPLSDFTAEISLATDDQPRISGQVSVTSQRDDDGTTTGTGFRLRLGGDVADLLPPERGAFFQGESQLLVQGERDSDGAISVPVMLIDTDALNLSGGFALNPQGAPQSASLLMTLGQAAGASQTPVRLPFGDAQTLVQTGRLELSYDQSAGDGWTLTGNLTDLTQPDLAIADLILDGAGQVKLEAESLAGLAGQISFVADGIAPEDAGLAAAIGKSLRGETRFDWQPENALELADLTVTGTDYGLSGDLLLGGLSGGVTASGWLQAEYADLSRLSLLAGRPLTGASTAELSGHITLLNRSFSFDARLEGQDITADQPQLDRILAGTSAISISASRDEDGIELSEFIIDTARLTSRASGTISSKDADLAATLRLDSLASIDAGVGGALVAQAHLTGGADARRVELNGEAVDLQTGIAQLDAALDGETRLHLAAQQQDDGFRIEELRLANPQLSLEGKGNLVPGAMDAQISGKVPDLGVMDGRWAGALTLEGQLTDHEGGLDMVLTGRGDGLAFGDPRIDGLLAGTSLLDLRATRQDEMIRITRARLGNDQISAEISGHWAQGDADLDARASLPSLRVMGPGYGGSIRLTGNLTEAGDGVRHVIVDGVITDLALAQNGANARLAGDASLTLRASEADGLIQLEVARIDNPGLRVSAQGRVGSGDSDLAARIEADSIAFLGRGIRGSVSFDANLRDDGTRQSVTANGRATGLALGVAQLDPLLAGTTQLDIDAFRTGDDITIRRLEAANPQLRITASGALSDAIRVGARLTNLGLVVPELPGALAIDGTLRQNGNQIGVDLAATGPGGARAQITGTVRQDFASTDLRMNGTGEAAIANPFLRVRSVQGPVRFDLTMRGPPGLDAVSGQVNLANASLADPNLGIRVDGLRLDARLDRGRIGLDVAGNIAAGGQIRAQGDITLTGARPIDLSVALDDVIFRDPNLYTTRADGQIAVSGTLAQGPLISGTIRLSQTELRIPSTGLGGATDIPEIEHLHSSAEARGTRARAGLLPWSGDDARAAGMSGPAATPPAVPPRLDLVIEAPTQIFIRGRGIDAEMGGRLRLTGRADNIVPIGMFQLIRGRIDLLGKRFNLTEGLLEMQGSMVPIIRLVAEANQDGITTYITIDGVAADPDITFSSSPDMPQEEVLSQLLFGRGLDRISPLQAAQLANAVAVLAGRGGEGIVGGLRKSVGLDDLDLATDDEGNVTLRAGKYLSENLYTDVAVGSDGTSVIELNLDITPELTARGSAGSDGSSAIGLFYERDF